MTNFRTSSSALDVTSDSAQATPASGVPVLPAEYLIEHPGTTPTLTVPATFGRLADLAAAWTYLAEAAEFFAVPMPTLADLSGACARFLRGTDELPLVAVHLTIVEIDATARVLIAREPVPTRSDSVLIDVSDSVRIDVSDDVSPLARPSDPWWRRMAARTTSRAFEDRLRRRFDAHGCADCIGADAVPFLGALVFETPSATHGLDNPEPTSVLDQLQDCGAITGIRRIDHVPADAQRAWWISPRFETRPVSAIGAIAYRVDAADPTFARSA